VDVYRNGWLIGQNMINLSKISTSAMNILRNIKVILIGRKMQQVERVLKELDSYLLLSKLLKANIHF
jgi:hypothetical protein